MKAGKLDNGFEYEIDENVFDDMRFLDALAEANEGDPLAASRMCTMLLGKEQKKKLYSTLAQEDGRVPVEDTLNTIVKIMQDISVEDSKN